MKTTLIALALLGSISSSFAVDGLTIPNSYQVDKEGRVFRGREPKKLVSELPGIGITDVLIFKNQVKKEVDAEIAALKELNIKSHHIPFKWKELESYEVACGQVIDALNLITKTKANGGSIFFHCTAGEDRTGLLAGLYRMLEEGITMNRVFRTEMCARGYSDGNPHKPGLVHGAIQKELTPLFLAMAAKIEDGTLQLGKLSKRVCKSIKPQPTTLKCN